MILRALVVVAMDLVDKGGVVLLVDLNPGGRTWTVLENESVLRKSLLHYVSVFAVFGRTVAGSVDGVLGRWRARTGK